MFLVFLRTFSMGFLCFTISLGVLNSFPSAWASSKVVGILTCKLASRVDGMRIHETFAIWENIIIEFEAFLYNNMLS